MRVTQKRLVVSILFLLLHVNTVSAQKITVAVVDLEGIGIAQVEAVALSNRLRNELFRLGTFKVVDRGLMQDILIEQNLQQTGCTSNECLVELGKLLGVQRMIGGSISKIENMFSVSTRVVDVETGEVLSVSDYDREAGLSEILTSGMKDVALSLSGAPGETVAIPAKREVVKPFVSAPDQSIKRFTWAIGAYRVWGNDYPITSFSIRTRRAFGSWLPIRPVLTAYYIGDWIDDYMYSLEVSYSIEGRVLRYTLLLGGIREGGGSEYGSFSFQIERKQGLPLMFEVRGGQRDGYETTSIVIGYRF
ncbi:MAG: CsgG/HfaB family protein [Candidatus Neomarinimicrobiota bacterium]